MEVPESGSVPPASQVELIACPGAHISTHGPWFEPGSDCASEGWLWKPLMPLSRRTGWP